MFEQRKSLVAYLEVNNQKLASSRVGARTGLRPMEINREFVRGRVGLVFCKISSHDVNR